jgi:bifunctional aspartokinase / homoserine dehydrogenase 1
LTIKVFLRKANIMTQLNVFILGTTGNIGSELIKQIQSQQKFLEHNLKIKINLVGFANSQKLYLNQSLDFSFLEKLKVSNISSFLDKNGQKYHIKEIIIFLKNIPKSIFVDCTSSDLVVFDYPEILTNQICIVTPNKKAASGNFKFYKNLQEISLKNNLKFLYETNVGAGLPIIQTLKDLVNSGDDILEIEGIFSGTLSYIFNNWQENQKFSEIVKIAEQKGFTEPDPRDDLNGLDVARKTLILAREIGFEGELSEINLQNLVPKALQNLPDKKEFLKLLPKFDLEFEKEFLNAKKNNKKLKYISKIKKIAKKDNQNNSKFEITIKLEAIDKFHPFFEVTKNDNIVSFLTSRYNPNPLIIKGSGAGKEVTSGGILVDILKCM